MTATELNKETVLETLRQLIDPEIGCNIVDLGLIYDVAITGGAVTVTMTLTTPGCPMHDSISYGVKNALLDLEGVRDVEVAVVWDSPWNPGMMSEAGCAAVGLR
jgi:metal-sulfur cluster biosynthetic enzyme